MPAVASGSLLAFAMSMDDVVISIFINGPRLSTLPIKVYTQIKTGVTPEINALCTIMLAFTVGDPSCLLSYKEVKDGSITVDLLTGYFLAKKITWNKSAFIFTA